MLIISYQSYSLFNKIKEQFVLIISRLVKLEFMGESATLWWFVRLEFHQGGLDMDKDNKFRNLMYFYRMYKVPRLQ